MRVFLLLITASLFVSFSAHARYDVQNLSSINSLANNLCDQGHSDTYVKTALQESVKENYHFLNLKFLTSLINGVSCNASALKVELSIDNFRGTWCQSVENPTGRRRLLSISPTFNGAQILFNGVAEVEDSVSGSWNYQAYYNELSFLYNGGQVDFVILHLDAEKLIMVSKESTGNTLEFRTCDHI